MLILVAVCENQVFCVFRIKHVLLSRLIVVMLDL